MLGMLKKENQFTPTQPEKGARVFNNIWVEDYES